MLARTSTPGRALDLACGGGRHTRLLVSHGFEVVAVDFAIACLRTVGGFGAHAVQAYAELLPFAPASFDLVVQTCFLDRAILPHVVELVRPGGVVLIETFLRAQHEATGHPRLEFCLEPGELERLCQTAGPELALFDTDEGDVGSATHPRHLAGIAARRL
jgi:SAM-dependent methyltransferase